MKISIPPRSKWPIQSATLVTDAPNLHMHMRELIRVTGWRMDDPPTVAEMSLTYLENGSSFLFIVEDTPTYPAYESVRTILSHPVGRLTPILVLLQEASFPDASIYQRVLHTSVAKKPLTPNLFVPSFKQCIDLWESPLFLVLRKCGYAILNGETESVVLTLKKLCEVPQAVSYATAALVQIYVEQNNWKDAESTIIEAIKLHPRLPSLMLTVASFYAQGRMPAQSLRFFKKLKGICNGSPIFSFDIAQTALALGQLDVAIEALSEWARSRPGSEKVNGFLARLYHSEGHDGELERILQMNKGAIKKLQENWDKAENSSVLQQAAS